MKCHLWKCFRRLPSDEHAVIHFPSMIPCMWLCKKCALLPKISISRYLLHGNRHSERACTMACTHRNYIGKLFYTVGMMVSKYECEPQKESWMSKIDQICLGCCDQISPSPLANSFVKEPPVETGNNVQYPPHLGFFLVNYGWYTKYNIERRCNLIYS